MHGRLLVIASVSLTLLLLAGGTQAAIVRATSCTQSDVQAALDQAVTGDTVVVPGSCSATWSALTIPGTKGLTLTGGNGGTTTINGSNALVVEANGTTTTRVTGFAFTGIGTSNDGDVRFDVSKSSAPFRLDHCTFTNTAQSVFVDVWGEGQGLLDHNTFTGGGASEEIHNNGTGPSDASSWTDDLTPGGANMVFIEDNTFKDTDTTYIASAVQAYYGARTVVRHNSFYFCQVDQHGTAGMIGARWWEIYENDFYPENLNQCCYADIRAGSGVIFNNREHGSPEYPPAHITLREEDTGTWPLAYQIGSGIDGNSDGHDSCPGPVDSSPAYLWGNSSTISIDSGSSSVQQGRDYFVSPTQPQSMRRKELRTDTCSTTYEYVPYPYPHPLQGGQTDGGAGTGGGGGATAAGGSGATGGGNTTGGTAGGGNARGGSAAGGNGATGGANATGGSGAAAATGGSTGSSNAPSSVDAGGCGCHSAGRTGSQDETWLLCVLFALSTLRRRRHPAAGEAIVTATRESAPELVRSPATRIGMVRQSQAPVDHDTMYTTWQKSVFDEQSPDGCRQP